MNEGQFRLVISQFARLQGQMWNLVEAHASDAASEALGPSRAMLNRLRRLSMETAKFEGMLDEAQVGLSFTIELVEKSQEKPGRKPA